jgi:transposase
VSAGENPSPIDFATLQARLAAALAARDAAIAERDQALSQNDRLMHLLRQLQRMQFGRKSEKLDPDQFALALEDVEQAIAASQADDDKQNKAVAEVRAKKRRANRGALPAHLPRVHVTIEPQDRDCPCCRSPMHAIGADVSERLDVIPAQYRVIVTRRPKYACRACEQTVVQAPAPERLIKGGVPTEAMVASVLVSKYAWHLPLYRQAQMLAVQGLDIKRSVLAFWVGYAAAELKPVYLRLRELILTSGKIAVDETKAPVLDPGRGRVKEGYFWAVARDDRPWSGKDPPAIAYTYAPGRGAVHALKLLDTYRGVVQCDGYAAYKTIAAKAPDGRIVLAFCWAHLRRRFFDQAKGDAPIAREALERIAALYAIEKTIRGLSADERRRVRQDKSKPLVMAFRTWLEQQLARVSGKSGLAEELRYGLNHWDGLVRFLDDGHIELDTNIVERGIRPIVTTESFCAPSSSVCKHGNLVLRFEVTRAAFAPHRSNNALALKVGGPDLVRRASDDLLCRQNSGFDQPADAMARNPTLLRGLSQGQPGPVLLGGEIGVDTSHAPDRSDTVRRPGFALAGRQSHAVQSGGDVLIRPAGRHAADDGQGVVRGVTVVAARLRLAEPELGVLASLPVDDQNDLARRFIDVDGDLVHQRSQQLLSGAHRDAGRLPRGLEVVGQAHKIRRRCRRNGLRRSG